MSLTTRESFELAVAELKKAADDCDAGKISPAQLTAKMNHVDALRANFLAAKAGTGQMYEESEIQRLAKSGALDGLGGASNGGGRGLADAVAHSGFNLKSNPSVMLSGSSVFTKANVFPASTALNATGPAGIACSGRMPGSCGRTCRVRTRATTPPSVTSCSLRGP